MPETATLHAIVLARHDSGENDRRLTLLTKEEGVADVIAKGARKGGSRLAGSSEPLCVAILHVAPGKRNRFVTQTQPVSSFPGVRRDYDRLVLALSLCELSAAVLPHGKPAEDEFEFLVKALTLFEVHERPLVHYVWAQLKLLELSGFQPRFNQCVVTGKRVAETPALVSPHAGGYVCAEEARAFNDCMAVRAEALYGLAAIASLALPPPNLKFAEEAAIALFPFWREYLHKRLPASEAVVGELRAALSAR